MFGLKRAFVGLTLAVSAMLGAAGPASAQLAAAPYTKAFRY